MIASSHAPSLTTALFAIIAVALLPPSASAKTCSSQTVSARGEPSSLQWLARAKAKANWRAKVRALPNLGDPYANWDRAENATEHCVSGPSKTTCDFTGIPCRKD